MIMIMTMTNADACSSHLISFHITVSKKQDEYIAPLDRDSELVLFNNHCDAPQKGSPTRPCVLGRGGVAT